MIALPLLDPALEIALASEGMSKGIAQTENGQIVIKPSLTLGPAQFGAQWKNIDSPAAEGEAAAFANLAKSIGRFQLSGGIAYKWQTGVHGRVDSTSWEFTGGATAKFGKLSLRTNAIYSPDDLGAARRSIFVEAGPSYEFGKGFRASAAIGRRHRVDGPDYTAFNAGIGYTLVKQLSLDVRYYDTAQSDLGRAYEPRVVGTMRLTF